MSALLLYPTLANCLEAESAFIEAGVSAASYPARITTLDGSVAPNCWNAEADIAEDMGFSVMQTVCLRCSVQHDCKLSGYLGQVRETAGASVCLATHQRAAHMGLHELSANRRFVSIHENPIDLLRPRVESSLSDLVQVQTVLNRMLTDPQFLDWFGDSQRVDEYGLPYSDRELAVRRERQLAFVRHLSRLVDHLVEHLATTSRTAPWRWEETQKRPQGIEATLFFATGVVGATFAGQPWRFILAAATGELHSAAIVVSRQFHRGGGQDRAFANPVAVGFRANPPHPDAVTWFNDATMSVARLQAILGTVVQDRTPVGHLPLQRKAVQLVRDITRRTTPAMLQNILRGVLSDRRHFRRIGIVCHQPHLLAIRSLEPEFQHRIVKIAYFGSGDERSSNDWYRECDLIVVAGTPRLAPAVIATYLVQVGEVEAACQGSTWGTIHWLGTTESNEPVIVASSGYLDQNWRLACRDLVRAAIVQAIGRGRGILEHGCEVVVLSNEECGLPVSDSKLQAINRNGVRILQALSQLARQIPNKSYIGKWRANTNEIASATGLSEGEVRKQLARLERLGQVAKVGERRGWIPIIDLHPTPGDAPMAPSRSNRNTAPVVDTGYPSRRQDVSEPNRDHDGGR